MGANCIMWSKSERQHVMVCPDDLCRNGSPLCGLERGIDFEEGDWGDDGYYDEPQGSGRASEVSE